MSVRFDAAGDYLIISSNPLNYNADYTIMGWIYQVTDTNTYASIFTLTGATDDDADGLETDTDGTTIQVTSNRSGAWAYSSIASLSLNTWTHVALVRSGNTLRGYVGDTTQVVTKATAGVASVQMGISRWRGTNELVNGRIAAVKAWTRVLTAEEIKAERLAVRPLNPASLYGWWPLQAHTDLVDYSGNAHPWTAGGTLTTEDGPPVGWGAPILVLPWVAASGGTQYDQSAAGALTPSGAALKQGGKTAAGVLTPAAILARLADKRTAGSLAPSGAQTRQAGKGTAGAVAPAGVLTALRAVLVVLAGALTPAGALVRRTGKGVAGVVTPVATLLMRAGKAAAGVVAPTATLGKRAGKAAAGALTPSGALATLRLLLRVFAGALAPSGGVVRSVAKRVAGAMAPGGALTAARAFLRTFTGAIAPSGALNTLKVLLRVFSGALTPVGGVVNQARKALAGAVTPAGAAMRRLTKSVSGALTPTGAMSAIKVLLRTFTGALASSGNLVRRAGVGMVGSVAATGALARSAALRWTGSLAPAGAVLRRAARMVIGALSPAGSIAIARAMLLIVGGALAPVGAVARDLRKEIAGQLAPVGAVAKAIGKRLVGALAGVGTLLAQVFGLSNVRLTVMLADAALTRCAVGDSATSVCALRDGVATRLTLGNTLYESL